MSVCSKSFVGENLPEAQRSFAAALAAAKDAGCDVSYSVEFGGEVGDDPEDTGEEEEGEEDNEGSHATPLCVLMPPLTHAFGSEGCESSSEDLPDPPDLSFVVPDGEGESEDSEDNEDSSDSSLGEVADDPGFNPARNPEPDPGMSAPQQADGAEGGHGEARSRWLLCCVQCS